MKLCMTLAWTTSTPSYLVAGSAGSAGSGGPVLRSAKSQKCSRNVTLYDRGRDLLNRSVTSKLEVGYKKAVMLPAPDLQCGV